MYHVFSLGEDLGEYDYFIAVNPCLAQSDKIDWEWVVCSSLSWPDVFKWECDQMSAVSSNQFWQTSFKHFEDSLTVTLIIHSQMPVWKINSIILFYAAEPCGICCHCWSHDLWQRGKSRHPWHTACNIQPVGLFHTGSITLGLIVI